MSNTILLEEQSFDTVFSDGRYAGELGSAVVIDDPVYIVYDGVCYTCSPTIEYDESYDYYYYGATYEEEHGWEVYDWSVYPFLFKCEHYASHPEDDYIAIDTQTGGEHTIAIYSELPRDYIDKVNLDGTEYDIRDTTSGYISEIVAGDNVTISLDSEGNPVISASGGGSATFRRWS